MSRSRGARERTGLKLWHQLLIVLRGTFLNRGIPGLIAGVQSCSQGKAHTGSHPKNETISQQGAKTPLNN